MNEKKRVFPHTVSATTIFFQLENCWEFWIIAANFNVLCKVHVFLEGRKKSRNLHSRFDVYLVSVKSMVEILYFCGLLIKNMNFKVVSQSFCQMLQEGVGSKPSSIYSWFLKPLSVLHSRFPTKKLCVVAPQKIFPTFFQFFSFLLLRNLLVRTLQCKTFF